MTRREMLRAGTAAVLSAKVSAVPALADASFENKRPPLAQRKFISNAVEKKLVDIKARIQDRQLAWMFDNCFPNALDQTVNVTVDAGGPDTFVTSGNFDAMWLRDSSAQLWPYLPLAKDDQPLKQMFQGLIRRHTRCILLDPYANAFTRDIKSPPLSRAKDDETSMLPGVAERKWELDSLCHPIRLAYGYWKATGDATPFDSDWKRSMHLVLATFSAQQRKQGRGPYHFQRHTTSAADTLALDGYGYRARSIGLIYSGFRPSDDACIYPLFIPGNLFALTALRWVQEMAFQVAHDPSLALECAITLSELSGTLGGLAKMQTSNGEVWPYEVDGYGNQLFMDDANLPSLLSLPYLGCCKVDDPLYRRTRARALSRENPYYFQGRIADGVGSPHNALFAVSPLAIIMRALTSQSEEEISMCLGMLKATVAASDGFMHESVDQDHPAQFTGKCYTLANSLFGELILKVGEEHTHLLATSF